MSSYVAPLSYVFSPSAGTINFSSQLGFNSACLKAVTDQTNNAFIYLPGVAGYGGTWDATKTILTLTANVSSYNANDLLLIQYDDQGNALSDIQNTLQGATVFNGQPTMAQPGAVFQSPAMQDQLRSLIAEVRMMSMIFTMLAREEIDFNTLKRNVIEQMPS